MPRTFAHTQHQHWQLAPTLAPNAHAPSTHVHHTLIADRRRDRLNPALRESIASVVFTTLAGAHTVQPVHHAQGLAMSPICVLLPSPVASPTCTPPVSLAPLSRLAPPTCPVTMSRHSCGVHRGVEPSHVSAPSSSWQAPPTCTLATLPHRCPALSLARTSSLVIAASGARKLALSACFHPVPAPHPRALRPGTESLCRPPQGTFTTSPAAAHGHNCVSARDDSCRVYQQCIRWPGRAAGSLDATLRGSGVMLRFNITAGGIIEGSGTHGTGGAA
ncbi:hypothetical protein FIBSPDRAFT_949821 [Athelia psychrophila]|uniref:Uncharacterized protein n=1 Tax=Athelia psychrophila TaxID=1759441 RepID=A0A166PFE1_9AGAM|nr:hypothetical protein FIBSPDRAFT_949821 [Fibularhizoctonia sp. CBS 109695]